MNAAGRFQDETPWYNGSSDQELGTMVYRGRVRNGVIIVDDPAVLEEGAEVTVQVVDGTSDAADKVAFDRYEHYRSLIGVLDAFPVDWSENHDNYLREQYGE
jgi:hypothetical protein